MGSTSLWRRIFGESPSRPTRQAAETVALLRALLSERGESSGRTLAQRALDSYHGLDDAGRAALFDTLSTAFSPAPEDVARAAEEYRSAPSPRTLARLQHVVEPVRQEIFRRLNMATGGTAAIVGMRAWLLARLDQHPSWAAIEADMLHLLRSWFNRGFLVLQRIDWRTSAIVLEKLIRYESVHAIDGWPDLHRRLENDRRCFAFVHPALPDEPLIFIEVAFTRGIAGDIRPLLDVASAVSDPKQANCAIFYSITNCQAGLRGISFGNFLVKQVVEELQREYPQLKTFSTLSPLPGFRRWLASTREQLAREPGGEAQAELLDRLDEPGWDQSPTRSLRELQALVLRMAAHYLVAARRGAKPLDPVARFHLVNGARLERLNWLGDRSAHGLQSSAGVMANYVYRMADIERNHERYAREHAVTAAKAVEKLARESPLAERRPQAVR